MTRSETTGRPENGIAARLGDVLYWAGNLIAVAIIAFAFWVRSRPEIIAPDTAFWITAAFALVPWLIGVACRYVLSGRHPF